MFDLKAHTRQQSSETDTDTRTQFIECTILRFSDVIACTTHAGGWYISQTEGVGNALHNKSMSRVYLFMHMLGYVVRFGDHTGQANHVQSGNSRANLIMARREACHLQMHQCCLDTQRTGLYKIGGKAAVAYMQ